MAKDCDLLIVGAGAAGIGAARRLAGSGLAVRIIEALPRIGGRAWSRVAAGVTLDMGCGWLHSADRNPWVAIAEAAGLPLDRRRPTWRMQYRGLGFPPDDQAAARAAFDAWSERIAADPPASDRASDALDPDSPWTPYLEALSSYISGAYLDQISARDYAAYDTASSDLNWRVIGGYGTLIASALPAGVPVSLATPVRAVHLEGPGVALDTAAGTLRARAAIFTLPTDILAGDSIRWPAALDPWRAAAARLPLGRNEKLFLDILDPGFDAPESHLIGNPRDATTGAFTLRPLGLPVIECYLGGDGARAAAENTDAAFAHAIDQLAALFGSGIRKQVRPLVASNWAKTPSIGGAYSHALPGHADARRVLARPFADRLFFAGEATEISDFSTAHGALASGIRAAEEALAVLTPAGGR